MLHLQGDLFDEMKRTLGRMPEAQLVTSVLLPMMSALLAMHSLGFIHRDIKPENTLFAAGRMLKLAGAPPRVCCCLLGAGSISCCKGDTVLPRFLSRFSGQKWMV
jgi:serine/threonine protein kinase